MVVIIAGTIRPATLRVSIASTGVIPYASARRLLAAVTKATCPLVSSSFSNSAIFKSLASPDKFVFAALTFEVIFFWKDSSSFSLMSSSMDSKNSSKASFASSLLTSNIPSPYISIRSLPVHCTKSMRYLFVVSPSSELPVAYNIGVGALRVPDQNGLSSSSVLSIGCCLRS